MAHLLPRHLELIARIDEAHARANPTRKVGALDHGQVKMGELSFIMANRVNGVSALHTKLMKSTVFAVLSRLHPDRIVNQTNGVTPRRWLRTCNPGLAGLITDTIGPDWIGDAERLTDLDAHIGDPAFRDRFAAVKSANKTELSNWVGAELNQSIDPAAIFDIQIKRIHEYKRQHLNVLEAIAMWQDIHDSPNGDWVPRVKFFGGKAASWVLVRQGNHPPDQFGCIADQQ